MTLTSNTAFNTTSGYALASTASFNSSNRRLSHLSRLRDRLPLVLVTLPLPTELLAAVARNPSCLRSTVVFPRSLNQLKVELQTTFDNVW